MNIVAIPSVPANDPGLQAERARVTDPTNGYRVRPYSSLDDLLKKLKDLLAGSDDCIEILEIDAHGSPTSCNSITLDNVQNFGEQLGLLNKLCKNCKIYLSGCNTANSWPPPPKGTMFPLPKLLAMATHCKVYATVGYTSGTHAEGNTQSNPTCNYNGHFYPKLPGCPICLPRGKSHRLSALQPSVNPIPTRHRRS